MAEESSVRVAVRIRPQSAREVIDMCRVCTSVTPGEPQVTLGADKAFTFDYVFDTQEVQTTIYEMCASSLVAGSLEGYNATILAYGQTGSGKTYTMGTGFETDVSEDTLGIIPRAITHLFEGIQNIAEQARQNGDSPPDVLVQAQFLELYNEEIIDLFDDTRDYKHKSSIKIHEDSGHSIYVTGATSRAIRSAGEAMGALRQGALSRTTASTAMNSQSSRSHAIFTLHIQQKRLVKVEEFQGGDEGGEEAESSSSNNKEFETLTAKFHFVDLAGSERLKRTGATGDRAKEGISINCGLLALGNVISALGDRSKRAIHIPYRDSKLTRLLQDSLGGNSRTVMIACVSPSDRDFMESLNTLKYANRARNIQNKIRLNQDKSSKTIMALRSEIQQLQLELLEYKQGKRVVGEDGEEQVNDMYHENIMLQTEVNNLRTRTKAMQETIDDLTKKNCQLLALKASGAWMNGADDPNTGAEGEDCCVKEIITGYCGEIEDLRSKLLISEHTNSQLRKSLSRAGGPPMGAPGGLAHSPSRVDDLYSVDTDLIAKAKEEVARNLNTLAEKKKRLISETEEAERNSDSESEESSSESESGSEGSVDSAYSQELATLTTEIEIKQKLILELERSHKRMQGIKQHYEDKFQQLQAKIRSTEEERDKVLASLTTTKNQPTEKVRKVRDDYEHRLNMMQKEMRNLTDAKKEYQKLLRSASSYENQVKSLRSEVSDMRQTRVRLIRKMKEETTKHKEQEIIRNREIAKLKKESRRAQNLIRNLESDKKTKEVILKRKQEEVNMLRKQSRARNPTASRFGVTKTKGDIGVSPKAAKIKWQNLEKNIASNTMNKQSVICLERDLEKLVSERQEKSHELQTKLRKLDDYRLKYPREKEFHRDLEEEIETLRANLDYINDSITEVQRNIIQVEDTKETLESGDLVSGLKTMPEVSYIIEKLYNMSINQSLIAAQRDTVIRELEAKLGHTEKEFQLQRELLNSLYGSRDQDNNMTLSMTQSVLSSNSNDGSSNSSSPTPADSMNGNATTMNTTFTLPPASSILDKAGKRKTGLPRDFVNGASGDFLDRLQMPPPLPVSQNPMTRSSQFATSGVPVSLRSLRSELPASPTPPRRTATSIDFSSSSPSPSPRLQRRGTFVLSSNSNLTQYKPGSMEHGLNGSGSPPSSPPTFRRSVSREEQSQNVFSRLTSGSIPPTEPVNSKGSIVPYQGKVGPRSPLVCTHVCQGHLRPVLSVDATDDLLFSASKDKTVRVWDLCEGKQVHSLGRHSHHATCVKFDPTNRLVYSVCAAYVKVWDMRSSNVMCVHTLCSSGTSLSSSSSLSSQLSTGEAPINAIALGGAGRLLYMATGERVKIWDARMNHRVTGTLSGGHQAPIMCMIVEEGGAHGQDLVVTGSKDHYIKVFDVSTDMEDCSSSTPKMNLEPPHYDGIQALAMRDNILFSGSRDYVIKKWNLSRQELVTSQSNAHKNWVCGLAYVPSQPLLLSACRSGTIKLWATEPFTQLGEMKAHNDSVNCITTNNDLVFTGSNGTNNNMYIWKLNSRLDTSSSDSNS